MIFVSFIDFLKCRVCIYRKLRLKIVSVYLSLLLLLALLYIAYISAYCLTDRSVLLIISLSFQTLLLKIFFLFYLSFLSSYHIIMPIHHFFCEKIYKILKKFKKKIHHVILTCLLLNCVLVFLILKFFLLRDRTSTLLLKLFFDQNFLNFHFLKIFSIFFVLEINSRALPNIIAI